MMVRKKEKNDLMEKIAILSLSFILVSTYSVSAITPRLLEAFSSKPRSLVELLVSVPSFGIAAMILLNIYLVRVITERTSIIVGSLMVLASAVVTMVCNDYVIFFLARLMLGLGVGMINARAVTTVQTRYEGKTLSTLLGIRGSMEVLGNMTLTYLAGRLLSFGWHATFAIYLSVVVILVLYLGFVPPTEVVRKKKREVAKKSVHPRYLLFVFFAGFLFINTNVATTMRLASFMIARGLGMEADASLVLSFMLLFGVLAGFLFQKLFSLFLDRTMAYGLLLYALGLFFIAPAHHQSFLYLGGACTGFANGVLATALFQEIAVKLPPEEVGTTTYAALLGCNLGGACAPLVLSFLGLFSEAHSFAYVSYGFICLALGGVLLVQRVRNSR